jgi:DNA polymerase III subunit gamma/tau
MGQALYRKYRSKSLSEIVGQEHITDTLGKAIKLGRVSHAYLFTGPRGVGKTSIARILAHEINGLPYTDESSHIDIVEIDAASNRRIDEIRELREKVYVAPTSAKYKVYIIDEVHMLTREAFNALLKTLEEPPAHVIFILATTDAHKLPETIVSRTQRFTFRPVEKQKVIEHLRHIAKEEKIKISDEALALLADHGEGSFRDSISLLDQAGSHHTTVEISDIQELLGIPPSESIDALVTGLQSGNVSQLLPTLLSLYEQGYQAAGIAKQLAAKLRRDISNGVLALNQHTALDLLAKLIEVPASHDPERFLEIIMLEKATAGSPAITPAIAVQQTAEPLPQPPGTTKKKNVPKPMEKDETNASTAEDTKEQGSPKRQHQTMSVIDEAIWPQVLEALKKKHNTLYGIVRMAHPNFDTAGRIELGFAFAFHQKRIMDAKNRKVLADIINELTGQQVEIVCTLNKELASAPKQPKAAPKAGSTDINAISNIFGGAELLES